MKPAVKLQLARPTGAPLSEAARKVSEGDEVQVKFRMRESEHRALKVRLASDGTTLQECMAELVRRFLKGEGGE